MLDALRTNPALLKLDLYCNGVRLDDSCYIEGDGGRKILRTRAGLGSGLELILSGGLWTNVPVTERFVERSPYTLHRLAQSADGRYLLRRDGAVGGIIRDTLGHEPSVLLRHEIYVMASVLGACTYVGLNGLGLDRLAAMIAGFLVTFSVRGLAIRFGWSLPVFRESANRDRG